MKHKIKVYNDGKYAGRHKFNWFYGAENEGAQGGFNDFLSYINQLV